MWYFFLYVSYNYDDAVIINKYFVPTCFQIAAANAAKTAIERMYGTEYDIGSASEILCKPAQ